MKKHFYREVLNKKIVDLFDNSDNNILDTLYFDENHKYTQLDKIASFLDLEIEKKPLPSMQSGSLENSKIIVNSVHHIHRQRFTIAHEIGHYLLQHEGTLLRTIDFDMYTDNQDYSNELEANDFAAKLLMPLIIIENYISDFRNANNLSNEENINGYILEELLSKIATNLLVSRTSLERRLNDLGILKYNE